MRRDESHQLEAAGQDSFLDVTTNIVGILIILVMIAGMRAKTSPAKAKEQEEAKAKVTALQVQASTVEYDARRIQQQLESIEAESSVQTEKRNALGVLMVTAEKELADRRSRLEADAQVEFDLKRQLDEAKRDIERGKREFSDLDSTKPPTQTVNHYPTPLSRTVHGEEIHFQLKEGRITYVPFKEFLDDIRQSTKNIYEGMAKVSVLGPRNGFELHYRLEPGVNRSGAMMVGAEFQVVPVGLQQGETIDQALSNRSEFRSAVARFSPRDTTVTLWTYPDSLADYRRLKEELYRLGYPTAGRPIPHGVLIGASSRGSKSSAQ
jgi:hypothetical protein